MVVFFGPKASFIVTVIVNHGERRVGGVEEEENAPGFPDMDVR